MLLFVEVWKNIFINMLPIFLKQPVSSNLISKLSSLLWCQVFYICDNNIESVSLFSFKFVAKISDCNENLQRLFIQTNL